MRHHPVLFSWIAPVVVGASVIAIAPGSRPLAMPTVASWSALWENPHDLADRDLYYGPWGREHAPDPTATYTYLRPKTGGTNPGVVVKDPIGREWAVKQAPTGANINRGDEGPVEVVLSRVLSAVGYHQPPVYYLPSFTMKDNHGSRLEPGGRFRLSDQHLTGRGNWSWQQNPFIGTDPFEGLLVILLMFNSSDLKTSNNTVYEFHDTDTTDARYVVRDLGAALGETGRFNPRRNNLDRFAREPIIAGVRRGFVEFNYHGFHTDIIVNRITPEEVGWASALLSRLSDVQWHDAFRAGGYAPAVADRFIGILHRRIAEGLRIAAGHASTPTETR